MGDVALSAPVLKLLETQNPQVQIILLTRKTFNPFFKNIPNLIIINPDFTEKHKGLFGLIRLFAEIKSLYHPQNIIDIHNVLRTKILRFLFFISGVKTTKIDKGRKEKKQLTKKNRKILIPLKHVTQRYADTFIKAGFKVDLTINNTNNPIQKNEENKLKKKIGIAPFAKHIQKQYPHELMKDVIQKLSLKSYEIYIFGGGESEKTIALDFEKTFINVKSLIGTLSLEKEIESIGKLDAFITMDSANMHIAALTETKVISILGATHPYAGFNPFMPNQHAIFVQNEQLSCRPCSVYGNKPCYKNNMECMYSIEPDIIIQAIENQLLKF